jgi:hypothetical protein
MRHYAGRVLPGVILLLFNPRLALAQGWFEWGTQGSYVHQFAHLLFAGAMLFFIYEMVHEGLQKYRGFRYLIWACGILAYWNVDAFVGHAVEWSMTNPVIMGHGLGRRLLMENYVSWVYYVTQFNHFFFLVPALYLFYRGLKTFAQESRSGP